MATRKRLSKAEQESCEKLLHQCEMFEKVPPKLVATLAGQMQPVHLNRNDNLVHQGDPCDGFFLLESGDIRRSFVDHDTGRLHNVEFDIKAASINSMRVIAGEPVHNTVKCVSDECKLYEMKRQTFLNLLKAKPEIAVRIAEGLSEEIRLASRKYATPLLEQRQQEDINMPAVSIAAGTESYYRSAMNAMLNARLTGGPRGKLFPKMHIQVPVRIAYITGFKGLRSYLEHKVDPDLYSYPTIARLGMAVTPGVIMTPISSLLEASNAGHMNKESMTTRWMRGAVPRGGREIIFGLGLNQLSDYFEERLEPYVGETHPMISNAAGSLLAGVVSGYLSHVPHNMSTYKLLEPHRSYGDLYRMFVDKSVPPFVEKIIQGWPAQYRGLARTVAATLFPRGLVIRTIQIVGSFMILNGTINYLQLREHHKIQMALTRRTTQAANNRDAM